MRVCLFHSRFRLALRGDSGIQVLSDSCPFRLAGLTPRRLIKNVVSAGGRPHNVPPGDRHLPRPAQRFPPSLENGLQGFLIRVTATCDTNPQLCGSVTAHRTFSVECRPRRATGRLSMEARLRVSNGISKCADVHVEVCAGRFPYPPTNEAGSHALSFWDLLVRIT